MKLMTILCAMVLPILAGAAAVKIKQVDNRRMKIVTKKTSKTTVGSEWVVTVKKGYQCSLPVVEIAGKIAILDGSDCPHFNKIRSGQWMKENLLAKTNSGKATIGRSSASSSNSSFGFSDLKGFSAFAFLSMTDEIPLSVKVNGIKSSGKGMTDNQFGVGAEYQYDLDYMLSDMRTAIRGGGSYEFSRSISSIKANGGSLKSSASFSLASFYLNGVIKIDDSITGFVGGNYSVPQSSGKYVVDDDLKFELDPAVGWQAGASVLVDDGFNLEGLYRSVSLPTKGGTADINGLVIRGRYIF